MKAISEETVVTETLSALHCNKCGRAIGKNDFGYFDDHASFNKTWGYHSPIDGETHDFDICIDCYLEWIHQFQIPPQIAERRYAEG